MSNNIEELKNTVDAECQNTGTPPAGPADLQQAPDPARSRLDVVVLQHPQEKKEALATVPLLQAVLPATKVKIGLSWPNLKTILKREVDTKRWGVLYLGTATESEVLKNASGQVHFVGETSDRNLEGIVILDGSWREVKALWWRNPWLLKLRRIVLKPEQPAIYHSLRREPRKESLSTLEAVAIVLSELDTPELYTKLTAPLKQLLQNAPKPRKKDWRKSRRRR